MGSFKYKSKQFLDELKGNRHLTGEIEFLGRLAKPGMRAIEAGANRGVTAVAVAEGVTAGGRVYAFEPVPEYYKELTENVSANAVDNIETHNLALSNAPGFVHIYRRGEGSGITPGDGAAEEAVYAQATTLDKFAAENHIDNLELLNLDCEGSELLVLQGARTVLEKYAPEIFCEIHHGFLKQLGQSVWDVVQVLRQSGYKVQPVQVEDLNAKANFENCSHVYARSKC